MRMSGVLDSSTYQSIRDQVIKATIDEPRAVIVDVSELEVPTESAWVVFTSARWHVGVWPDVPILLVCRHAIGRSAIIRNGVVRYVPLYPTVDDAFEALATSGTPPQRRRARASLPAALSSLRRSRALTEEWLTAWHQPDMIAVCKVIVTALVENVLQHTDSEPCVRLETDGTRVTIAVSDASRKPAAISEAAAAAETPCGLRIVGALSLIWGNVPTPSGKTVWVVVGPENRL
jgi:hypothetical protein